MTTAISPEAAKRIKQMRSMRFIGMLAGFLPVGLTRVLVKATAGMGTVPAGVGYHAATGLAPTLKGVWATPVNARPGAVLLYLHGGGYSTGSPASHARLAGHLARETGVATLILDYRLAPEHRFPAASDDAFAAYRTLLDSHSADQIILAGDSVGGALVLATMMAARDNGLPQPAAAALLSPMIDFTWSTQSWKTNARRDVLMTRTAAHVAAKKYLGKTESDDPRVSPLLGRLDGLAPLLAQVGGDEVLLDEAKNLAARVTEVGGAAKITVYPGLQHVFQLQAGNVPEADRAIAEIGHFLRGHLDAAQDPA